LVGNHLPEFLKKSPGSTGIGAVILAAGKSERFGSPKVLQQFHGLPFLSCITRSLRQAGVEKIILVLGHRADKVIPQLAEAETVQVVINNRYEEGQFSSLQVGIQSLEFSLGGILLCLIDQPHLQVSIYQIIIKKAQALPKKILVPAYQCHGGHPVFLPGWIFPEITAQPSTISLRELFSRFPDEIVRIEVDDPGILEDIDTRADLNRLEDMIPKAF